MKKKLALIMVLCLAVTMSLCACGKPTPTETADTFLTAIKAQDSETMKMVYVGSDDDIIGDVVKGDEDKDGEEASNDTDVDDFIADKEIEKMFTEKLLDFDYELSNEKIDGNKATVDVKITTYNMGTIFSGFISEYFSQALMLAFSDASEEQLTKIGTTILKDKLNSATEKNYTDTVRLNLVQEDDIWKVAELDEEGDFINLMCGNLFKFMQETIDAYSF